MAGFPPLPAQYLAIEQIFLHAPASADLHGRKLATLDEVVDGGERNVEVLSRFFNGD